MIRAVVLVAVATLAVALVGTYLGTRRNDSDRPLQRASEPADARVLPNKLASDSTSEGGDAPAASSGQPAPQPPAPPKPHPLLHEADEAVLADGQKDVRSTAEPKLAELMRVLVGSRDQPGELPALTIDYPLDATVFPPEIVPPTFLWHEPSGQADTWLIDVALADKTEHLYILSPGKPPAAGPIDPTCIAKSNEVYRPTPYQASAKSWTPNAEVWAAVKRGSVKAAACVTIFGFCNNDPAKILSRGRTSIRTSSDPVGAPIFYRDVPLAPALTEKGVIKPLREDFVSLIGWRLRDISKPESRLLLTDVPTCTNCHSFSADGKTLGMDLDGPQGDKGAYVIAPVTKHTKFTDKDVISWNSFPDKPAGHKTIGFLSRVSPNGQYVASTLNEAVYVCNFMDYRFLQVFFPTRGILGYYSRATGQIKTLPGADDPKYVHCDPVWTPDGEYLVFARAEAKDPYPADEKLAQRAGDPAETQIQYNLYRIPFRGGRGGKPEPIAGASDNGMSNTFPKVSPDGKWIVFVKCRNGQLMRPDSTLWIVPARGGTARLMRCNTRRMNSWHSFSPNGRWMVFSSKANTPYTQMFLIHIDQDGNDSPAVLVPNSTAANRAVNIPEFINVAYDELASIDVPALEYFRRTQRGVQLRKQGQFDQAIAEFDTAVKLQPDFLHAHIEAAVALTQKGKADEAMARLNKALALDPKHAIAHGTMGFVLAQSGKLEEALDRFQTALKLDPRYQTVHANVGRIYLEWGKLLHAEHHFRRAVELDDNDPLAHYGLAIVLFNRGMPAEAIEQCRKTVAIDPQHIDAHLLLGKTLAAQGDFRAAVAQLQKAVAVDPNNISPIADLAWLLAACPQDGVRNGAKAVELAERACAVTSYQSPVLLNALAAAYAETGNFSKAIDTATKALTLVGPQDKLLAQWIGQNLRQYQAGKPCRLSSRQSLR